MDLKSILNDEEIGFLKDLAHELKTQDRGGTNKPVYFSILDRNIKYDSDDSDGFDTVNIFDNDGEKLETLEDLQEHIINNPFEFEIEDFNEEDIRNYDIDEIVAIYKEAGYYISYGHYQKELKNAFLTKKSAEEHLKENAHHYDEKVGIYTNYAWRNPTLEKLLNIIEKFDI